MVDSSDQLDLYCAGPPRAAVVIGCYNNEEFICQAIESIRRQSFSSWMCLIVDNSSTDLSSSLISNCIAGDERFGFLAKENQGPGAWRNFAASHLPDSVDYIHFLDGDDLLEPAFLAEAVSYLDLHPNVGLLNFQFNIIDESGYLLGPGHRSRFAPSRLGLPSSIPDEIYPTPFATFFSATGQGPFCVFRKSVFDQTTGYEVDFWSHEDSDICCQMAMIADCHQLPLRLYNKRTHSQNLTYSPRRDYSKFRRKWDFYCASNPPQQHVLDSALSYYYKRHVPMRDFKVSLKALKEFLREGNINKLVFASHLIAHGLTNLFFHTEYRRIIGLRLHS